jgi:formamidopyrimidine-DNA glycosylase
MPELPEVETIRQDLRKKILHKKITKLEILKSKLGNKKDKEIEKILTGAQVNDIKRYGKLLVFELNRDNLFMLVHLKMTGQLLYQYDHKLIVGGHSFSTLNSDLPDKHTQTVFYFNDHSKLFFNDLRRFGYIKVVSQEELSHIIGKFGIEPLQKSFTFKNFVELLHKKKMILKALLMNQALIAGIGNIYADEICFCAGVLPSRRTDTLLDTEVKKLFLCSQSVIKKAIKYRGTTFNDYVDGEGRQGKFSNFLQVYGRKGLICKRCKKEIILKKKLAGRGTHYCRQCQK